MTETNKSTTAIILAFVILVWSVFSIFFINTTLEKKEAYKETIEREETTHNTPQPKKVPASNDADTSEAEYGIGINVTIGKPFGGYDDVIYIASVSPNSPASKMGLKVNDIIWEVDGIGIDADQTSVEYVSSLIRGKRGTSVDIIVYRENEYLSYMVSRTYKIIEPVKNELK